MGVCSCDIEIIGLLSKELSLSLWHVRSHVYSKACVMISLPDLIKILFKLDVSPDVS